MQKFRVNDFVKCINTDLLPGNELAPPLMKLQVYQVKGIVLDAKGNQHLDVGIASDLMFVRSYETKEMLPNGDTIHWCHPSRFELSHR